MSLVVPNASEAFLLGKMLSQNSTSLTTFQLRLLQSNITPGADTTLSACLAAEASTTLGYLPATLTASNWSVVQNASSTGRARATYSSPTTFTITTAATLYGYFVTDAAVTSLCWVENFVSGASPSPFVLSSSGGSVIITLTIDLASV